jgi:hypothetical protein
MRSQWITHNGKQIFYQNFSGVDIGHSESVLAELQAVQAEVVKQAHHSVCVLADFRETSIGRDLLQAMTESSNLTKSHVRKTAVLGITGTKRMMANLLMSVTRQDLRMFEDETKAKDWLAED